METTKTRLLVRNLAERAKEIGEPILLFAKDENGINILMGDTEERVADMVHEALTNVEHENILRMLEAVLLQIFMENPIEANVFCQSLWGLVKGYKKHGDMGGVFQEPSKN